MDKIIGQLIAHFKEIVPLDETDINAIIPKLEIKELDKKDYLIQPGQVSRHMRFIAKGACILTIQMKMGVSIRHNSELKTGGLMICTVI